MGAVYYKKLIEGVSVPAVIHNSNYFLIQMAVYEDGTVSCWHRSDLEQFREDLGRGWVVPAVPAGKSLSIHGLGSFPVLEARWKYGSRSYYYHIRDIVRSLNPEMANLYRMTKREKDKWEKARVTWWAKPIHCKLKEGLGYKLLDGDSGYIFYRAEGRLHLTPLTAYEDQSLWIDAADGRLFTLEEIDEMFRDKTLCTSLEEPEWVSIQGLGEVLLAPGEYKSLTVKAKLEEINDTLSRLAGERDSLERCRAAHYEYLCDPNDWTRENLRKAYEAVPEHQRMYLGNMDDKDSDFCRIIYHPDQKREV